VHPNGRFLYAANENPIGMVSAFSIASLGDAGSGRLAFLVPCLWRVGLDPKGVCLLAANQDSATVVVFRIDPNTGDLPPSGNAVQIPSPVSLVFALP
jgi:6-phosphogluconolactonase